MTKNKRNKVIALTTAVLLIVALAAMGTIAWLTATDDVTNTFTVGKFEKPDVNPDNPDPDLPDNEEDEPDVPGKNLDLSGYIVEPAWDTTKYPTLLPKAEIWKNPYVGIGDGSQKAKVYVYVQNPFTNDSVYFKLNSGWSAVEGEADEVADMSGYYTGGMFEYDNTLEASGDGTNTWTETPVFSKILVAEDVDSKDLPANVVPGEDGAETLRNDIIVKAFLHQVDSGIETEPITEDEMLEAAKLAFGLTD